MSNNSFIFDNQWQQLLGQGLARLPHALLLTGPPGVGKRGFAEKLAALLLCESPLPSRQACANCQACRWLEADNHPDFRLIEPEGDDEEEGAEKLADNARKKANRTIKVDQIWDLESFVFVGSHRAGNRVVLISEADAMNAVAANAVLKILEEPPSTVYFILVSSRTKTLLPTIRSRCRQLPFGRPQRDAALAWLAGNGLSGKAARYLDLAGGSPRRVVEWSEQKQLPQIDGLIDSLLAPASDPIQLAARWDGLLKGDGGFRMEQLVDGVQRWIHDLALERAGVPVRYHTGWGRPKGIERLDPQALGAAWREIGDMRRSARHPLNPLLFLESLATHFLRAVRPAP